MSPDYSTHKSGSYWNDRTRWDFPKKTSQGSFDRGKTWLVGRKEWYM